NPTRRIGTGPCEPGGLRRASSRSLKKIHVWGMPANPVRPTHAGRRGQMADSKANEEAHWDKTTKLMLTHLGIWFFFGYIIHMFVVPLNKIVIPILGFPLGFYMAAQGSLIVFVV